VEVENSYHILISIGLFYSVHVHGHSMIGSECIYTRLTSVKKCIKAKGSGHGQRREYGQTVRNDKLHILKETFF
jgi:hypothetical protein